MSRLLLMRHGEAEMSAGPDCRRRLTRYGVRQVDAMARSLAEEVLPVSIACSPYRRAKQTAQRLQKVFGIPSVVWDELVPLGAPGTVVRRLAVAPGHQWLLVTHQPLISTLIEYLTDTEVAMNTASVAAIQCDGMSRGCGEIEWIRHGSESMQ